MKKLTTRILSILLAIIMIGGIVPLSLFKFRTEAAGTDTIVSILKDIKTVYPAGSYFSVNRKRCAHKNTKETRHSCSNCKLGNILDSTDCKSIKRFKNNKYIGNSWTCCSFAYFCFTQCFGLKPTSSNYKKTGQSDKYYKKNKHFGKASNSIKYQFLQKAQIGDLLYFYNWSDKENNYVHAHYAVFISCDSSGVTVYDSNVGGSDSKDKTIHYSGNVRYGKISYSKLHWDAIDIIHANNYNEVAGVTYAPAKDAKKTKSYDGGTAVFLKSATSGATIYYTLDGKKPSTKSTVYNSSKGIDIKKNTTIRAIAVKSGLKSSIEYKEKFTINKEATPLISDPVEDENGISVSITADKNAKIYYTIDGSNPITEGIKYIGPIYIDKNVIINAVAISNGKAFSDTASKTINAVAPNAPTVSLSGSANVAIGEQINVEWNKINNASEFIVTIKKDDAEIDCVTVSGCVYSFVPQNAGSYIIGVKASNAVGVSDTDGSVIITVHPDVMVTFKDYDGRVLATSKVAYGHSATVPVAPTRDGFTFAGWSGNYNNVKADTVVTAEYTPKAYTIRFVDEAGALLSNQSVDYGLSAVPPQAPEKNGYSFTGWSLRSGDGDSYTAVNGNAVFEPVYVWANIDLPLGVTVTEAKHNSSGYAVKVKITNGKNEIISGKMITVIKTANDKVIATAIDQIEVPASANNKEYNVTINSRNNAMLCQVYIVGNDEYNDDKTGGALSEVASMTVTLEGNEYWPDEFSEWSTTPVSPSSTVEVETKTQYRYRDKEEIQSYETAVDGYTKTDKVTWVDQGNTTVDYVKAWPSGSSTTKGFKTSHELYKKYNNKSKVKSAGDSTDTVRYTKVSETEYKYLYWHWCYKHDMDSPQNCVFGNHNEYKVGNKTTKYFHAFESSKPLTWKSAKNCYVKNKSSYCPYNENWAGKTYGKEGQLIVYRYIYKTEKAQYTFERWGEWSDWSDTEYTAIDNSREVETRTLYRYKKLIVDADSSYTVNEDLTGTPYNISGNLSEMVGNYDGKKADVIVYKGKNSDGTEIQIEYIGQITLGSNNSYSFSFIPKEEITTETGDFIVSFAVATATRLVNNVEVIEAPKPVHKVEFRDASDAVLSVQNVTEGSAATAPNLTNPEGYTLKWDKSFTNITADTVIRAVADAKEYNVIFVDFENDEIVSIKQAKYGETVTYPADRSAEGMIFKGWSQSPDSIITGTTVITAEYEPIMFTVSFLNKDGSVFASQQVAYGSFADIPEENPTADGFEFIAWNAENAWWNIKQDISINPIFIYENTVETPVVSDESINFGTGALDLNTATEEAEIHYTTDGSEPTVEDLLFEDIIWVEETTTFKAKAFKEGMNPSDVTEITVEVIPENESPMVAALTNVSQYVIGDNYAKLCMKIDNPQGYTIKTFGYFIENRTTGEEKYQEYDSMAGSTDKVIRKVFTFNNLTNNSYYSYYFFVTFDVDDDELYLDSRPRTAEEEESAFVIGKLYSEDSGDGSADYSNAKVTIKNPSTTTINYGYTLVLHTTLENIPEGTHIVWKFNGSSVKGNGDNDHCNVTVNSSGDTTVTAVLCDSSGNPVKDANGNEISSSIKITAKAGFFQKLIAFFKNLFRANMVIDG